MKLLTFRFHFLLVLGIGILLESCNYLPPAPDSRFLLAPSLELDKSPAFQRALRSERKSPSYEKARIDYLLEVISRCPYNFIRNGSRYNSQRARLHLKWKYYLNRWQVKTAEEFIDVVASGSKSTGQPYLIELPDRRHYPLKLLFLKETKRFDEELEKRSSFQTDSSQ